MTAELTTNEEIIETDNSDVVTEDKEPVVQDDNTDNSDVEVKEPVETVEEETPSRFNSLEDATKSYSELEKKLGEQSNELGELRKKAALVEELQQNQQNFLNTYGFDSIEEYNTYQNEQKFDKDVAIFQADEYAKNLSKADDAEEVKSLLIQYRNAPSSELLDIIESQFPIEVVKDVSGNTAIFKGQLQQQQYEIQQKAIEDSARNYLEENIKKYPEQFNNPAFAELYGEAFRAYGVNLNTDRFMSLLNDYANSVLAANGIKNGIALENSQATDEIAGLANTNTTTSAPEKNILEMSEEEVKRELKKYR